jgi:hypothetical protein
VDGLDRPEGGALLDALPNLGLGRAGLAAGAAAGQDEGHEEEGKE